MSEQYLHRGDAPFGDGVWEQIDHAVVEAAKSQLSGRQILHTMGPFGLGLKAVPLGDAQAKGKTVEGVTVSTSDGLPLAMLRSGFSLPVRDIAAYAQSGVPLDLGSAAQAAIAVARQEDQLVYNGFGGTGLLNASGVGSVKLKTWNEVGAAVEDIINAATELDNADFHGPYTLALAPKLYNRLFRRYSEGQMTELEHIRQIATGGVIKAAAIPAGGVLVDTSGSFASIVLGQDLMAGFVGPSAGEYEFSVSETLALWIKQPQAVCVLK
ncbi:MAG: family 1 encapsulin nanocompartment shell protein [Phycisphaerales bacterium]